MKYKAEIITLTSIGLIITILVSSYVVPYLYYSSSPSWSYFVKAEFGTTVKMSDDSDHIALKHSDKLYMFSRYNPTPLWVYDPLQEIHSFDMSRDGDHVAIATDFGVYFFNRSQSSPIWSSGFSTSEISKVVISSNGSYILGCNDNYVYFFNESSSEPMWKYKHGANYGRYVAISGDGNDIVVATDTRIFLFNKSSPIPEWNVSTIGLYALEISENGKYIITMDGNDHIILYNKSSSTPIWNYDLEDISPDRSSLSISSDGTIIAVDNGYSIHILNNTHPYPIYNYTISNVHAIDLTPDGNYLTLVTSKTIYLYQMFNPNPICIYTPKDARWLYSVEISSDASHISATGWATLAFLNRLHPYMANEFDPWSDTNYIVFSVCLSLMAFIIGQYGNYVVKKKKKEADKKDQKTNEADKIKRENEREEEIKRFKDRFKELDSDT